MRATPFLSYAVDADGPWHGLADCAKSLEVMPVGRTGDLHRFHLLGTGVDDEAVARLESLLDGALHSIVTIHHDHVTKRWEAQGFLEDTRLQAGCLAVPMAMGGFEVPWIHIDERGASVRLLPASDPDLFMLHARLEKELGRRVCVTYLDHNQYEHWVRRLHAAA